MPYLVLDGSGDVLTTYDGPAANAPAGAVAVTAGVIAGLPFPYAGWKYQGGALVAPAVVAPTLVQQAVAGQNAGFAITSTGTPALDGTYPASGAGWADLKDEALFIASFGAFSTGASTLPFMLPSGATVTFTATSQVQAVVKAIAMYLTALKTIAATGAGTLPAAAGTIA